KKRTTADVDEPPVGLTAARACSTSRESQATSVGSAERLRTTERWVAVRRYSTTSSSTSVALIFRRRLLARNCRRFHSAPCSLTNASKSTYESSGVVPMISVRDTDAVTVLADVSQTRILTGEAVHLDVRVARVGSRALARVIDAFCQVVLQLTL